MKSKIKTKLSLVLLCILLSLLILKFVQIQSPVRVAKYCVNDKCVTIVVLYNRVISGGDSQIRVYKRDVYTRFFLNLGSYAEFPIETHILISKNLVNGKILISSQSSPIIIGDFKNKVIFKKMKNYSEGDNKSISSFDLDYKSL